MRKTYLLVCAIVFVGAIFWLDKQDTPENAVLSQLNSYSTMKLMKEYDPESWKTIYNEMLSIEKEGENVQQVVGSIQLVSTNFMLARLPTAPDVDVINYAKDNLKKLTIVGKSGSENCFRYIAPSIDGPLNAEVMVKLFPRATMDKFDMTTAALIKDSYGSSHHIVTESERKQASDDYHAVISNLQEEYQQDIELLSEPVKGVTKKQRVCDIENAFWEKVVSYPVPRSAGMIRMLNEQ